MADDLDDEDIDGEIDEEESGGSGGGKKKLIIIIAAVLLLLIGGGAGAYFMGMLDPLLGGGEPEMADAAETPEGEAGAGTSATDESAAMIEPKGPGVFHEVPEFLVVLNSPGKKQTFLKLQVVLSVGNELDLPYLTNIEPRITNAFLYFLREKSPEDLEGSIGMHRLREGLLKRAKAAAAPVKVYDVLIKLMLVQ